MTTTGRAGIVVIEGILLNELFTQQSRYCLISRGLPVCLLLNHAFYIRKPFISFFALGGVRFGDAIPSSHVPHHVDISELYLVISNK